MTLHDPYLGQQVAHFQLEQRLGEGELGTVYLGRDLVLERPVAIKVIETADTTRFVQAARRIAAWRHPHIIQIQYVAAEDDQCFVVMEYVEGQNLEELLADYRVDGMLLPPEHVLLIGRAIASALDYAHSQGVVHRAIKPTNVLISADDRIILTDFGLALDQQRGTRGSAVGSPHYTAPEQAVRSSDAVPQSDLYALGVLLYELLTGTRPFDHASPIALALQHQTQTPPSPRERNPELPAAAEDVLLRALRKQPAQRYQSGAALMDALETALQSTPARSLKDRRQAQAPMSVAASIGLQRGEDPLIGTQLDTYAIEVLLGQGGMARIYRGRDVRLNRTVAIKVIDLPYQGDADYTLRFEREAQAIAQLDHPNIVHLYYYGEARGVLYMVMQYIEGQDLHSLLADRRQRRAPFSAQEILQMTRNVCFALDYAHSKGVIHRDVHPGNILVDGRGRAILTDFGLALMTAVGTRGEIFGTAQYIAPEQATSSANVVPQTDLYAWGVILYELVTGRVPFDGPNAMDTARRHIQEQPRPVRELRPGASPAVEAVIMRSLAKQPADRYATGAELATALASALQQGGGHA